MFTRNKVLTTNLLIASIGMGLAQSSAYADEWDWAREPTNSVLIHNNDCKVGDHQKIHIFTNNRFSSDSPQHMWIELKPGESKSVEIVRTCLYKTKEAWENPDPYWNQTACNWRIEAEGQVGGARVTSDYNHDVLPVTVTCSKNWIGSCECHTNY